MRGEYPDAGYGAQIDAVEAGEQAAQVEGGSGFACGFAFDRSGLGRNDRGGRRDRFESPLQFGVDVGDLFLEELMPLESLAQAEEVLGAIVAGERFDERRRGRLDALVAMLGQRGGITFTVEDGRDDRRASLTGDVGENVMNLEVHLIERLVDMLNVPAGVAHERVALAPECSHATHFGGGAKSRPEETNGVQVLEPLAVHHVCFATGHVLHVAGIDQANLDLRLLE